MVLILRNSKWYDGSVIVLTNSHLFFSLSVWYYPSLANVDCVWVLSPPISESAGTQIPAATIAHLPPSELFTSTRVNLAIILSFQRTSAMEPVEIWRGFGGQTIDIEMRDNWQMEAKAALWWIDLIIPHQWKRDRRKKCHTGSTLVPWVVTHFFKNFLLRNRQTYARPPATVARFALKYVYQINQWKLDTKMGSWLMCHSQSSFGYSKYSTGVIFYAFNQKRASLNPLNPHLTCYSHPK